MALLNIRNLTVKFATATGSFTAVDGIDVSVDKGEVLASTAQRCAGSRIARANRPESLRRASAPSVR